MPPISLELYAEDDGWSNSGQISSFNLSRLEKEEEDDRLLVKFETFAKQMLGLGVLRDFTL